MPKSTKQTYYKYICPVCKFNVGVGNWKEFLDAEYFNHYFEDHFPKPIIIKTEKR